MAYQDVFGVHELWWAHRWLIYGVGRAGKRYFSVDKKSRNICLHTLTALRELSYIRGSGLFIPPKITEMNMKEMIDQIERNIKYKYKPKANALLILQYAVIGHDKVTYCIVST